MKNFTNYVLFFLFNLMLLPSLTAQMSKELVKVPPSPPIENKEGEPELLTFKERLKALIDKESLFLNSDVSKEEIARLLRTSPSVVEAILESDFGQDYGTFINSRRIKSAIELLNHPDNQEVDFEDKDMVESLLSEITIQCGFKSVNQLTKHFKKQKGFTIDEYIEEELAEE